MGRRRGRSLVFSYRRQREVAILRRWPSRCAQQCASARNERYAYPVSPRRVDIRGNKTGRFAFEDRGWQQVYNAYEAIAILHSYRVIYIATQIKRFTRQQTRFRPRPCSFLSLSRSSSLARSFVLALSLALARFLARSFVLALSLARSLVRSLALARSLVRFYFDRASKERELIESNRWANRTSK